MTTTITFSLRLPSLALVGATLLGGCGKLADQHTSPPPLLTLHGTLTERPAALVGDAPLAVAILWGVKNSQSDYHLPPGLLDGGAAACPLAPRTVDETESGSVFVTQSVAFQPEFPVAFQLPLTELPPSTAQVDLTRIPGGSGVASVGQIIVYQDGNGNGRFDFPSPGTPSPDRIVAGSWDFVFYLDGVLPTEIAPKDDPSQLDLADGLSIPQGFSLVEIVWTPPYVNQVLSATTALTFTADKPGDTNSLGLCATKLVHWTVTASAPDDGSFPCYYQGHWYQPIWSQPTQTDVCTVNASFSYNCVADADAPMGIYDSSGMVRPKVPGPGDLCTAR
jgi:hypothetical protein